MCLTQFFLYRFKHPLKLKFSTVPSKWLLFIIILLSFWKSTLSSLNTSLGFLYIIIAINYWIRDVIREYIKKYEVLIFIVFLIFVFSEGMLFLSFFWASFHSSCSPAILFVPDPCELTYTNTLLLSNAALSLGCAFICRENNQNTDIKIFPTIPSYSATDTRLTE